MKLLAEYFAWNLKGGNQPLSDVVKALEDAGLDGKEALPLTTTDAFSRACKKLAQARIVRQVSKSTEEVVFQFTKEFRDKKEYSYSLEAFLKLNKETGTVRCDANPELAKIAQEELNKAITVRTGNDASRLIKRIFKKADKDLWDCQEVGGLYCVPADHLPLADKVEAFVLALGGTTKRIPVYEDGAEGTGSVSVARDIKAGLLEMVEQHVKNIEELDLKTTRDCTLERQVEKIKLSKLKIEGYQELLRGGAGELEEKLKEASQLLKRKVEEVYKARGEDTRSEKEDAA